MSETKLLDKFHVFVTGTAGVDFVQSGRTQNVYMLPPFYNTFISLSDWQSVFDGGGSIGIETTLPYRFRVQTGVAGYGDTPIPSYGNIELFGLPVFTNLTYDYDIQNHRIMFSGKVFNDALTYKSIHPYFSFELGSSRNTSKNYFEDLLEPTAVPTAPFADKSTTSFSWGVGMGGDYFLNEHFRVGLGYQFADLGSAALGPSPHAATTQSLTIPHLWTNQLRFQLTAIL